MRARILRSAKRDFQCRNEKGEDFFAPAAATLLKGKDNHLVVGDWVSLEGKEQELSITSVEERSNEIFRISPREQKKKVIASNCDVILIVTSVSKPKYKAGLIDRYLIRAIQWQVPVFLVFNKCDEKAKKLDLAFEAKRVQGLGVRCFEVSAKDDNYQTQFLVDGIEELKHSLKGKLSILLGQSGVGKSKLISSLSDHTIELKSKELAKVGKGSHTTTWAEIIDCPNFAIIDSPGIRSMSLADVSGEELEDYFPDLFPYFKNCRFSDCGHNENATGCAFFAEQELPDTIWSRFQSFQKIKKELSETAEWERKDY